MNKQELINQLDAELQKATELRERARTNPDLQASRTALKLYQSQRLRQTQADFLSNPQTSRAAEFFLKEIYGTKDTSGRDQDLSKVLPVMEKTFPLNALEVIAKALTLDALTETLDTKMALALGPNFTQAEYEEAFRTTSTLEERQRQLDMVSDLGNLLCSLVRIPFLGASIKMMRLPAKIAGVFTLHEFLENGFMTFKETKNPEVFVHTLIQREKALLEEIYTPSNIPLPPAPLYSGAEYTKSPK